MKNLRKFLLLGALALMSATFVSAQCVPATVQWINYNACNGTANNVWIKSTGKITVPNGVTLTLNNPKIDGSIEVALGGTLNMVNCQNASMVGKIHVYGTFNYNGFVTNTLWIDQFSLFGGTATVNSNEFKIFVLKMTGGPTTLNATNLSFKYNDLIDFNAHVNVANNVTLLQHGSTWITNTLYGIWHVTNSFNAEPYHNIVLHGCIASDYTNIYTSDGVSGDGNWQVFMSLGCVGASVFNASSVSLTVRCPCPFAFGFATMINTSVPFCP